MTRDEFVQKAISKGLTDPIKLKSALNDYRTEIGAFDDDAQPSPAPPSQKGLMETIGETPQRIAKNWKEDVPQSIAGVQERTLERAERVEKPTVLGSMAVEATGAHGPVAGAVEAIAGTPERAGRLVGGAAGTMAEIPSLAVTLGAKAFENVTGINLGNVIKPIADKVIGSQPVQKALEWWEKLSEAEKANYSSAIDIGELLGYGGAAKVGEKTVEGLTVIGKKQAAGKVEKAIEKGFEKGVLPRYTSEKKSLSGMRKFKAKGKMAVNAINEYKDELNILDDVGNRVELPKNNAQFAEAIEQTKKKIYKEYADMAILAGDAGAMFDVKRINTKLDEIIKGPKHKKRSPEIREYAAKLKEQLQELDGESPEVIQDRIKELNKSLEGYYADRVTKTKAEVDVSVAEAMRKELDDNITKAVGVQYQPLKDKYGALKAIEKDVNLTALRLAKKANKGFMDITDVFTNSEIAIGIATLNPALILKGATGRLTKQYIKWLNNPNRYIGNMFKTVAEEIPTKPFIRTYHTPEKPIYSNISESLEEPTYLRQGLNPEADFAAQQAKLSEIQNAIRQLRPKVTEQQSNIEAMRQFQRGISQY